MRSAMPSAEYLRFCALVNLWYPLFAKIFRIVDASREICLFAATYRCNVDDAHTHWRRKARKLATTYASISFDTFHGLRPHFA